MAYFVSVKHWWKFVTWHHFDTNNLLETDTNSIVYTSWMWVLLYAENIYQFNFSHKVCWKHIKQKNERLSGFTQWDFTEINLWEKIFFYKLRHGEFLIA